MRVLILYTELAEYVITCLEKLAENAEVHVLRYPVNAEAPFEFSFSSRLNIYNRKEYDLAGLLQLAQQLQPDIVVCSGWIDKDYLKVVKSFRKRIATVMTCDTQWRGDLRQNLARIYSRFFLLPLFTHAWVPGKSQQTYVKKLGFKKIQLGFYSCDLQKFNAGFSSELIAQRVKAKRFLFVGRYYDFKGIEDLWSAFIQFNEQQGKDWELWCLGTGSITPINHPKIKHFGFVQPKDLAPIIEACTVFVLPSRYEPWAVVVHEYAAAGYPLIVSNKVGAREAFVEHGENGYVFEAGNVVALKEALQKMAELSDKAVISMSERSHRLAQKISPDTWAQTVIDIHNEYARK